MKVVVVGTGFIGPVHVEGLKRAGIEVLGIVEITPERSVEAGRKYGLPKAYLSYEEALADPDVESVHITTPNRLHYSQVKAAIAAGKHVLCEKPLAMNSVETAELVQLAAESDRVCGVNYNIRFYPICLHAKEMVKAGELGRVFSVCGSYVQDWLLYDTDYNWRVLAEEGGALRAVADVGTHWLDLVQSMTGLRVSAVCADLATVHPVRKRPMGEIETFTGKTKTESDLLPVDISTDDYGAILLRFEGGAKGVLWVSQVTAGRKNCLRWEIAAEHKALAWESELPNELWIGNRSEPNAHLLRDPSLLKPEASAHTGYPGGHIEGFPDTFKQMFRAFYGYIAYGDFSKPRPFPTFEDGHREVQLCDAILKSHQIQSWVEMPR